MIRRRTFITLLGGAAATWPLAARAQEPPTPVIGYLSSDSPESSLAKATLATFRKGLGDAGYVEDHNFTFEYRWGNGQEDRVPELAADLVRRRVAVIATAGGNLTARAAKAATTSIPIVFAIGGDPVALGLVRSLSRPGGNITGVTNLNGELNAKRIELLAELIPNVTTIGFLMNPNSPAKADIIQSVRAAGQSLRRNIEILNARSGEEIENAFASAAERHLEAVAISGDNILNTESERIATLTRQHAISVISPVRDVPVSGGLMSYGTRFSDLTREAGIYIARILRGEKPGDLPVIQPTRFDFVINVKTAKVLGLTIPPTLRALATEVIE
jgi:putative ABC transport system substrate-binding protein